MNICRSADDHLIYFPLHAESCFGFSSKPLAEGIQALNDTEHRADTVLAEAVDSGRLSNVVANASDLIEKTNACMTDRRSDIYRAIE
jgi:hypothetical protein